MAYKENEKGRLERLSEDTIREITSSPVAWRDYLDTACRNYKCSFEQQLLIYAQRPDATAILPMKKWNEIFGRWVNKGSKAIRLIDPATRHIDLYFDISDTRETEYAKPVRIWEYKPEYETALIDALSDRYNILEKPDHLTVAVNNAVLKHCNEHAKAYISAVAELSQKPLTQSVADEFICLSEESAVYMILSRCGLASDVANQFDFVGLEHFSQNPMLFGALGQSAMDMAGAVLKDISAQIQSIEKGIIENGNQSNLQSSGRLHDPRPRDPENRNSREIRQSEGELPSAEQTGGVRNDAPVRALGGSLQRDRAEGGTEGDGADRADGQSGTDVDRGAEGRASDEVGRSDELDPTLSRGDRAEGADLHLKDPITVAEIDAVLQSGSGFVDGKLRIYEQFQKHLPSAENAAFLAKEYGIGGWSEKLVDPYSLSIATNGKGLSIIRRLSFTEGTKLNLSWKQVSERIQALISDDRYLSAKELTE